MHGYTDEYYDLYRFVEAPNPVYDEVCLELRQGFKMTQLKGDIMCLESFLKSTW